jgi:hypothetical protein
MIEIGGRFGEMLAWARTSEGTVNGHPRAIQMRTIHRRVAVRAGGQWGFAFPPVLHSNPAVDGNQPVNRPRSPIDPAQGIE